MTYLSDKTASALRSNLLQIVAIPKASSWGPDLTRSNTDKVGSCGISSSSGGSSQWGEHCMQTDLCIHRQFSLSCCYLLQRVLVSDGTLLDDSVSALSGVVVAARVLTLMSTGQSLITGCRTLEVERSDATWDQLNVTTARQSNLPQLEVNHVQTILHSPSTNAYH